MLSNFFDNISDIVNLHIDAYVDDQEQLTVNKEKSKNVTITRMRYKDKPFLMLINDNKTIILYTYEGKQGING